MSTWTTVYEDTNKRIDKDETGAERITYANPNENTIRQQAGTALAANRTFVGRGATNTAAQTRDQTIALSRQVNGLLRVLLDDLTGTD